MINKVRSQNPEFSRGLIILRPHRNSFCKDNLRPTTKTSHLKRQGLRPKFFDKLVQILSLILIFSLFEGNIFARLISLQFYASANELTCLITRDCLAVLISESVVIELNSKKLNQGKLESWNLGSLTISTGKNSQTIPVNEIKKVEFTGDILVPQGNNYLKVSEDKGIIEQQKTWEDIPLTNFSLADRGQIALLQLRNVLEEKDWQNLVNNSQDFIYALDEIEFDQKQRKMIVKVSPIAQNR